MGKLPTGSCQAGGPRSKEDIVGSAERIERQKAALREKILDAAWEIFAREGYEAATVRRIADAIDYSPTAIYFYFGDKASLIKAVCDRESLRLAKRMAPLTAVGDPVERLRAIAKVYVKFAEEHPNEYMVMFVRPRPPVEGLQEHPHRGKPETDAYSLLVATVEEILDEHHPGSGLDPHVVAQAAWGAIHGPVSLHLLKDQEQWVEWRDLGDTVGFLIDAIAGSLCKTK